MRNLQFTVRLYIMLTESYMRVPLETTKSMKSFSHDWESNSNSNIASSVAESDSIDAESGFDEMEVSDVNNATVKFVTRFVDKVCSESRVTQEHIKALHQMVPGVVAMHIETLEAVHRESKRLPPIQKPKILKPTYLHGEEIIMDGLRVYMLPDGRDEGTGGNMGGPSLLPAEGAIFLTNYRIIFKGIPCDPLACEQVVVRYFPVSTLTKEKSIKLQYTPHIDQLPKEGLQLRSNIFQLMKLAFDEEVSPEDIEAFKKLAHKYRNPTSVFMTFAFTGQVIKQTTPLHKQKEKNASLRHFAKKTLIKTARKAGIKTKQPSSRKHKYILPTPPLLRRSVTSSRSSTGSDSESDRPNSEIYDELSIIDEGEYTVTLSNDPKNLEKLMEKPGYQDYKRLGFGDFSTPHQRSRTDPFRISTVNANFSICRSYPALIVVPQNVTDDSIRKLARTHRQYRFPVITWKHPRTKALLLRASGFHGSRGLMTMLKSDGTSSTTTTGETSSSLEQERYFSSIVQATPNSCKSFDPSGSDSLTSLDSLVMVGATESLNVPDTPDLLRKSAAYKTGSMRSISKPKATASSRDSLISLVDSLPSMRRSSMFLRAVNSLRMSAGKGHAFLTLPRKTRSRSSYWQTFGRMGSFREKSRLSTASFDPAMASRLAQNGGLMDSPGDIINSSVQGLKRVSLYVLGEKAQMKGIKMDSFPKCDFIPVDFYEVRHVKASFKKLMRACVPSAPTTVDQSFMKSVEDSEWLLQIQNILQLAGASVDLLDVQGSSVMICLEDGWDFTTQELHKIETDLGHLPQKWKPLWDKIAGSNHDSMIRNSSFNTQIVRSHGRSIHKRSTLEILVKGKMLGEAAKMFSQPHRFEKYTYTTPAYCDYCSQVLWGLLKTAAGTLTGSIGQAFEQYSTSSTGEHRTHEGYLYKRGVMLKGWKQRWFVLDNMKNQLRYYDALEDSNCRGYIDMLEVVSVHPIKNVQGAPKKAEENAFFELKTNKRVYNFMAADAKTAQEWIDKIQSFI
ncbi:hypothetical protein KUTeg_009240 [Tegillarca granosa]|uniref:Myotubularin-related protein 13 n=1 Tax=Tegillarca granosa TaxID=220873 RepID=A0ABQ9F772_TEGGR|nr:hypothetical protein KUTeg_009240 [Tegillarca granosa]